MGFEVDITKDVMDNLREEIQKLSLLLQEERCSPPINRKYTDDQLNLFEDRLRDYLKRESSFIEHQVTFIRKIAYSEEHKLEIKVAVAQNLKAIMVEEDAEVLKQPIEIEHLTYIPTERTYKGKYEYILIDSPERLYNLQMIAMEGYE